MPISDTVDNFIEEITSSIMLGGKSEDNHKFLVILPTFPAHHPGYCSAVLFATSIVGGAQCLQDTSKVSGGHCFLPFFFPSFFYFYDRNRGKQEGERERGREITVTLLHNL